METEDPCYDCDRLSAIPLDRLERVVKNYYALSDVAERGGPITRRLAKWMLKRIPPLIKDSQDSVKDQYNLAAIYLELNRMNSKPGLVTIDDLEKEDIANARRRHANRTL